jgi:hypothetical protein
MKYCWLGCLLLGSQVFAGTQDSDLNVNRRYTVDTVIVAGKGWQTNVADQQTDKFSSGLRRDLAALVGQKLNPGILDGLAARLMKEFSAREVSHHVLRGDTPDHVRVEFEVLPAHYGVDATVTKFLYDSKQGWSGAGSLGFTVQQNTFAFGLASDGDTLNERFAGISARYENKHLGSDRVGLRFLFESYHQQWNQSTLDDLAAHPGLTSDAYRMRQNFEPTATISVARPLTLEIGVSCERFQDQFPAAHTETANALVSTLRYHRRLPDSQYQQDVYADYTLRAAAKLLGSDFVYTSQLAGVRYRVAHGKHQLMEQAVAGTISGRAPLADRFVAGNTYYLRGWNKYEIDPIGGNRLVHNTVEYRYGAFQAFYDAGAVWDSGQQATLRNSVGVGFKKSLFSLAAAFPVKSGHIEPILMIGMIY